MEVQYSGDMIFLNTSGAEISALYRAYLNMYGEQDLATKDVFVAVANRFPTWEEKFHISDASTIAYALEDAGMMETARQVFDAANAIYENDREETQWKMI